MAVGREYCVYIMTNNHNTVIYSGVTNNLARRVYEHKNGVGGTFTKKYNICKLVYYEVMSLRGGGFSRRSNLRLNKWSCLVNQYDQTGDCFAPFHSARNDMNEAETLVAGLCGFGSLYNW